VTDNFYNKKDAEVLTVTGLSVVLPLAFSSQGGAAFTDRPLAEILLRRFVALDPEAQNARALQLLGLMECSTPKSIGGKPEQGYALLRRAVAITKRQDLGMLVLMAERCAVAFQDRKLFRRLLDEVTRARDHEKFRLSNLFARYKAERLITRENDLFFDQSL
jgi:hypothetical protein